MPTTRLSLPLPLGTDLVDPTLAIGNAMDIIDQNFDSVVCTSTTHPAAPFDGMIIYETDTFRVLVYQASNTSWNVIGRANPPQGKKALVWSNAQGSSVGQNQEGGPFLTCTFTSVKGQVYGIRFSLHIEEVVTNLINFGGNQLRLRGMPGSTITSAGNLMWWQYADINAGAANTQMAHGGFTTFTESGVGQQYTIGLFLSRDNSNNAQIRLAANQFHTLMVEDIGNAGTLA